jgi:hypothetical protein
MSAMRIPATLVLAAVLTAIIYKVNEKPPRKPTDPPASEVQGAQWKLSVLDDKGAELGTTTLVAANPRQLKLSMAEMCQSYAGARVKADSLASKLKYDQACSELTQ